MELFGLGVCPVQVFSPVDNRSPVQICQEAVLPYLEFIIKHFEKLEAQPKPSVTHQVSGYCYNSPASKKEKGLKHHLDFSIREL